jgi:hypothetical protein
MSRLKQLVGWLLGEPVLVSVAVSLIVTAAARFGLNLTADQVLAVSAAVASALGIVTRQLVAPTQAP